MGAPSQNGPETERILITLSEYDKFRAYEIGKRHHQAHDRANTTQPSADSVQKHAKQQNFISHERN